MISTSAISRPLCHPSLSLSTLHSFLSLSILRRSPPSRFHRFHSVFIRSRLPRPVLPQSPPTLLLSLTRNDFRHYQRNVQLHGKRSKCARLEHPAHTLQAVAPSMQPLHFEAYCATKSQPKQYSDYIMCVTCIIHRCDVTFDEREYRIEGGGAERPPLSVLGQKDPPGGVGVCNCVRRAATMRGAGIALYDTHVATHVAEKASLHNRYAQRCVQTPTQNKNPKQNPTATC